MLLRALSIGFATLFASVLAHGTTITTTPLRDVEQLETAMPKIASAVLATLDPEDSEDRLNTQFRLQLLAGLDAEALESITALREKMQARSAPDAALMYAQYEVFLKARLLQRAQSQDFAAAFTAEFMEHFAQLDDKTALRAARAYDFNLQRARTDLDAAFAEVKGSTQLSVESAIRLARSYQPYRVYQQILPLTQALIDADNERRYVMQKVKINGDHGVELSAWVVRSRALRGKQPTALNFTIYATPRFGPNAPLPAAAEGFVSVLAYSRGKGASNSTIAPYEHEVEDVNTVIDWIAKQPWSNGDVGMYGGSYEGFSQWAATKRLHPALKTIVPYVAAIPGLGLPMENNVFLNANYGWAFYVTNNRFLDDGVYDNRERWNALNQRWFQSGQPYRQFDRIDGTPNPWLQRWLEHPSFDRYWQGMVPYGKDYARINIPVLSITGYYDDGQISALHYLREHERFNRAPKHYLVIGPYDHFGAQSAQKEAVLRGYPIDPVAQFSTPELTFQWLNHVLRDGPLPALLKDRINYQIMGANTWGHAGSLRQLHEDKQIYYLARTQAGPYRQLSTNKPRRHAAGVQVIDFADRTQQTNAYYPGEILSDGPDLAGGIGYVTEVFAQPVTFAGSFSGRFDVRINKRDVDLGVVLYELTADGKCIHLSYFLGRASYAKDMSQRRLLQPGRISSIPFERTRMVAREIKAGSRLLVVVNVNKNAFAQINYGSGRDVSDESIKDARTPLRIEWLNSSYIALPLQSR